MPRRWGGWGASAQRPRGWRPGSTSCSIPHAGTAAGTSDLDPVVATVNGDVIRRSEYDRAVAARDGKQVLDALIGERLIEAEARKRGIVVDDQRLTQLVDERRKNFTDDAAFQAVLQRSGLTEHTLRAQLRSQELMRQLVADQATVTEQEVTSPLQRDEGTVRRADVGPG